jgi:N-acetylglucosamine-6-sulfatase
MSTRLLLTALVAVAVIAGRTPAADAPGSPRPNIVFVLVDDIRWDAFGCMGHPWVKTPNIDRVAREGALFKNFFVSIPLCAPSRSSFLTGRYAHATGVTTNGNHNALSHQLVTWPRLLHDAGYETAYVGKWHMGNDDTPRPGFDRWVSFKGQGVYPNPNLNIDGQPEKVDGYVTDLLDKYAVEFVRKPHDKPFALYLAHKAVHGPFTPAERHKDLYANEPFTPSASANDTREGKPAITQNRPRPGAAAKAKAKAPPAGRHPGEGVMRSQLRCLAAIDDGLGDILKALEETKQLDNTLIAFTSDNGYFWGEHGGLGDKRWAYEESIRLPLFVRYPKLIKPGTTIDALTLNIDIAPSFLELAGAAVPKDVQGKSLLPLFRGDTSGWRKAFLTEYFQEGMYPQVPTWRAVRTDRWKYIHYPDNASWDELYDLRADPHEMKNLIHEESAQATLKELRAELDRLWKETDGK